MALGNIIEIRVVPLEGRVRVSVRRKTDIGQMTVTLTGNEINETLRNIAAQHEAREMEIKQFRERNYPHLVTWEPIGYPKG
jgi:hypothetical protein